MAQSKCLQSFRGCVFKKKKLIGFSYAAGVAFVRSNFIQMVLRWAGYVAHEKH
jgi:hypothetical protein